MSEPYQEELQRRMAKRESEHAAVSTELAARRILTAAGWNASVDELRAAAEADEDLKPERYDAVVARAIEMQTDETVRGRRVLAATATSEESVETESIPQAKRDEIREWLRSRRQNFPNLNIKDAHAQVLKVFGVVIAFENFRVTYWKKAAPSENGKARAPKRAPEPTPQASAAPKPAKPGAQPRDATNSGNDVTAPLPLPPPQLIWPVLAVEKHPFEDRARVRVDIELPFPEAMALVCQIGAALGPQEAAEEAEVAA